MLGGAPAQIVGADVAEPSGGGAFHDERVEEFGGEWLSPSDGGLRVDSPDG